MTTIIDELIVTLGLNAQNYQKGRRQVDEQDRKSDQAAAKRDREDQERRKRQGESFDNLTQKAAEFTAVLVGAKGLTDFVAKTIEGDAAAGRLAKNLGVSTENLTAWEGVLRQAGGTTEDAAGALQSLVTASQQLQLTSSSPLVPYLQMLGVSLRDLQDPSKTLLTIADVFSKMDPRRAAAIGAGLGFSPTMVSTLERGRPAIQAMLDAQIKAGVVHEADAQKAQALQQKLALLNSAYSRLGNDILNEVLPPATAFLTNLTNFAETHPAVTKGIMEIVVALGALKAALTVLSLVGVKTTVGTAIRSTVGGVLAAGGPLAAAIRTGGPIGAFLWEAFHPDTTDNNDAIMARVNARGAATRGAVGAGGGGIGSKLLVALKAAGLTDAQAQGVIAGVMAESGGNSRSRNPTSGAIGLAQWLGPRRAALMQKYGSNPTEDDQIKFLVAELTQRQGAGVRSAGSSSASLAAFITQFERPAPGAETIGDLRRGTAYLRGQARSASAVRGVTSTTTIDTVLVNAPRATDATGIARGIQGAMSQHGFVPQSDTAQF